MANRHDERLGTMIMAETSLQSKTQASVIDLFCGVGGLSYGLLLEALSPVAGIDIDEDCRYPYERNISAPFIRKDIATLSGEFLKDLFVPNTVSVLVGCAPCQPFSTYAQKSQNPRWKLLNDFGRLIIEAKPDIVSMENVPRLISFRKGKIFQDFVTLLEQDGYTVTWDIVYAPDYGVPQQRSRLVLLASRYGGLSLIKPTHRSTKYKSVADAIAELPSISAGGIDSSDPLHRAAGLSPKNLERIRASLPGGTWRDWPDSLVADCHKEASGRGYASVYGRMLWNEPSPTITTQFYGYGNGRFGHPEQDRAISLREGAILQTFPRNYAFIEPGEDIHFRRLGRLIGNAVPVELARAIAKSITEHINRYAV